MFIWTNIMAVIALVMSIICFVLFVIDARKPVRSIEEIVALIVGQRDPAVDAVPIVDPATAVALARNIVSLITKAGGGAVALAGAIIFLVLAGAAAGIYAVR